jgi:BNR repeat-like domain
MRASVISRSIEVLERRPLHSETYAYCAHPHMAVAADGAWLLVFNRAPRREIILHPPQDPEYRNVLMRSEDEGRTWSAPAVAPDYNWSGVECAGLTGLRSGRILLNQWRFEWLPLPLAQKLGRRDIVMPERLIAGLISSPDIGAFSKFAGGASAAARAFPWARGGGETVVHLSDDGGRSFFASRRIDTGRFSGGYGMRGALELASGDILLPLSDVPDYRQVFVVRSPDGGQTWSSPCLVASEAAHEYEEPAGIVLQSGRIVLMLRDNGSRLMHSVFSDDEGRTWSKPRPTGIAAYPAHLLALPDGRIACVAGRRQPPYGIVLHLSIDGEDWDPQPTFLIDDLRTKDLGYPTAALRSNGDLVVIYYTQNVDGVTGIHLVTARLQ